MPTLDSIMNEMTAILDGAEGRTLTDDEVGRYEALEASMAAERRSDEVRARQQAYNTPVPLQHVPVGTLTNDDGPRNPLAFSRAALDGIQAAMRSRQPGEFAGDLTDERLRLMNAALTTTTYGQPAAWGANLLSGPRLLHQVAGVGTEPIDAVLAEFPKLTLPAAAASSAEGATLAEFAASTGGTVTLGRFGRFTDLTQESQIGTGAGPVIAAHQVGIARDLNKSLIDSANTDAGTAVAFTADVPAAIRKSMATVLDNTAEEDPARLVVMVHPDNASLLENVTPIGGNSIGEKFQRFSGALVFPSGLVPTGFMLVANLSAGTRYFEARGVATRVDEDVKTGVQTVATSLIGGYGTLLVASYVQKVDVVTP